ncbi:MAG: heparinase II/III family protein [Rhizomicrobium sp.]
MELSVFGQRLLIDPGTPTYSAGLLRDFSRSAAVHNGPAFVGLEPIDFWDSFRVGRRGYAWPLPLGILGKFAPLGALAIQDGYAPWNGKVVRWLSFWPDIGLLVTDYWSAPEDLDASLSWLIDPSWKYANGHLSYGEKTVELKVLSGRLGDPVAAACWQRFGKEQVTVSVPVKPEAMGRRRVAAVWFGWGAIVRCRPSISNRLRNSSVLW